MRALTVCLAFLGALTNFDISVHQSKHMKEQTHTNTKTTESNRQHRVGVGDYELMFAGNLSYAGIFTFLGVYLTTVILAPGAREGRL